MRAIPGQGRRATSVPATPAGTSRPASSTTAMSMPGSGPVAEPGFSVVTPGRGTSIDAPVSDCHQVSMIGSSPRPKVRWNQIQASGLIASPTVPSRRSVDRSWPAGSASPNQLMKVRMRVGAV